ncbi:YD repeat protein, partial [Ostertagia ostertagi]
MTQRVVRRTDGCRRPCDQRTRPETAADAADAADAAAAAIPMQMKIAHGTGQTRAKGGSSNSEKWSWPGIAPQAAHGTSRTTRRDNDARGLTVTPSVTPAVKGPGPLCTNECAGVRYATIGYDAQGYAISTALAGGANQYTVNYYGVAPGTIAAVTDPFGNSRAYQYSSVRGIAAVTYSGVPSLTGLPDANTRVQNELGLIDSETDFRGTIKAYEWDPTRRLPLTVTEAVGQPESRTRTTTWHPQWRLPATITEPGRVTSYTYDSLGNTLSQTVTDSASGVSRTTNWTYHTSGLVATETAPNGAVSSYQYDSAGNLTQSTNALGQVDSYTHNGAGRVLSHTAANGLVTSYTYDARGRMLTSTVGGLVTTLTYRPSGQVATATLPHGHVVTYQYDAAQRLTGWSDNRGAGATYVLDGMGNRTSEEVRNAQGQAVWQLARTINSLNRVETTTAGSQGATSYGYDTNGDLVYTTNALGQTTHYGLDALRRVQNITNAQNATASLTYNALDSVTQASDFKGVATSYVRDALGNAKTEASSDAGTQSAQYDSLGLPSSVTNALGHATTILRDSLGRPTSITHAGGAGIASQTIALRYDLAGSAYNQPGQPGASK